MSFICGAADVTFGFLLSGFRENNNIKASIEASQELLLKVFSHDNISETFMNLIACVLNLHYQRDPKQVSKYFTDTFLEKLKSMRDLKESDSATFQCLKHIGLNDESVCAEIISFLQPYTGNSTGDFALREKAKEICRWLVNPQLSIRVIHRQESILKNEASLDLTLSFLDNYVVQSLEDGEMPFKPFSLTMENTNQERVSGGEAQEAHWSATQSMASDDAHSSTPSTGTGLTSANSHSSNLFIR